MHFNHASVPQHRNSRTIQSSLTLIPSLPPPLSAYLLVWFPKEMQNRHSHLSKSSPNSYRDLMRGSGCLLFFGAAVLASAGASDHGSLQYDDGRRMAEMSHPLSAGIRGSEADHLPRKRSWWRELTNKGHGGESGHKKSSSDSSSSDEGEDGGGRHHRGGGQGSGGAGFLCENGILEGGYCCSVRLLRNQFFTVPKKMYTSRIGSSTWVDVCAGKTCRDRCSPRLTALGYKRGVGILPPVSLTKTYGSFLLSSTRFELC